MRNITTYILWIAIIFTSSALCTQRSDDVNSLTLQPLIQQQAELIQQQAAQLQALQTRVRSMETTLSHNTAQLATLKASTQKQAAFSVTLTGSHNPLDIGHSAPIHFDQVVTNIAHGYDPQNGIFAAPYGGVYAFFLSLRSDNDHGWLSVGIFTGSTLLATATADGSSDFYDKGSTFVTTHLNKGQQVYARHTSGDTYLESGYLTTFSGVLVSPD